MVSEGAKPIKDAAADWAVRADRGLTVAEEGALAEWLVADERHKGAFVRMTSVLLASDVEDADPAITAPPARPPRSANRRQWLIGGGGAMAASLAGAGVHRLLGDAKRFDTRKGEKRPVMLADGSVVTLNTATRIEVDFSKRERLVRLVDGEALFDVAKDPARPFIVRAGNTDVRAVGTSFTVMKTPGRAVQVLVREGVVEVVRPDEPRHEPVRVAANTRAIVASEAVPTVIDKIEASEVARELAWQQGRLVFTGESLSSAVGQFARYSDIRIRIADPELAGRSVAGVYDSTDVVGFAKAIAYSFEAHAEVREGEVVISRGGS